MLADYIGTNELKNKEAQLRRQLEAIKANIQAQIAKAVKPVVMNNYKMAQQLILAEYKALAFVTFQEEFQKAYGSGNYVPESLNGSLRFDINNLSPYLSYDISKFIVKYDYKQDIRAFNQNANIEGSFGRNMDFEEIDAIEEANFYGLQFDTSESPYEYAENENGSASDDVQVFSGRDIIKPPKYTYLNAQNKLQEKWLVQYPILKSLIKKKYNIDI